MSLLFFTALDLCGKIIHADPYFHKRPWYDWMSVHWEAMNSKHEPYTCPAKVLAFFEISNHPTMDSGIYCVIHSTEYDEKKRGSVDDAIDLWGDRGDSPFCMYWTMETSLQIVPASSIANVSYVIPDFIDEDMSEETGFVIEIYPLEEWGIPSSMLNY